MNLLHPASVGIRAMNYLGLMANIWDGSNSGDRKLSTNIFARMLSLEHGNNRDNCCEDITHEQTIGKQISYRSYKRILSFNGYFYKEDFLYWFLDLDDLFDFENIYYERKVKLVCINLVGIPYISGNKYSLIGLDKVKTKFIHGQG